MTRSFIPVLPSAGPAAGRQRAVPAMGKAGRIGLALLCATVALPGARTAGAVASDLLDCYRSAAATSPDTARSRALLRSSEGRRDAARGRLLPSLLLQGTVGRNAVDLQGFGAPIDETYTSVSFNARVTQPLVDARDWSLLREAGYQVRAGTAGTLRSDQQLMLAVARRYFGVLAAQAEVRTVSSEQDLLAKTLARAKAAQRVGSGDIIAVKEAKAGLDSARSRLVLARNRLQIARCALGLITHAPLGKLKDLGHIAPLTPVPPDIDAWVNTALSRHPLRQEAAERWNAAREQVRAEARARLPTVAADAGYGYADGYLLPSAKEKQFSLGLSLNFPLFQGGAVAARTRAAQAEAQALWETLRAVDDQIALATQTAFLNFRSSAAEYRAAAQALASAQASLEASRKGYEIGTRSVVDFLASVRTHTAAQSAYDLALYQNVLDRLELDAAAGTLCKDDIKAVDKLLVDGGTKPAATRAGTGAGPAVSPPGE